MSVYHDRDGLFFKRHDDGSVSIIKTNDGKYPATDNIVFLHTMDSNIWASAVLSMTKFSERPGDWATFLKHHNGESDMLVGQRGGY